MEFSIRFPPSAGPDSLAASARAAEDAGFETIWAVDTPLIAGELFDPYVDLAVCAMNTAKINLGPAVSTFALRHPVATASAILSVDRISGGRSRLGLGIGGSAMTTLGQRSTHLGSKAHATEARRQELRDGIIALRKMFRGEGVSFGSREIKLLEPHDIPIYLAASGPKALRLAGEVADGAIIQVGVDPGTMKDAIAKVHEGAESAGRDPSEIRIVASVFGVVSNDREDDINRIRPVSSFFYSITPQYLEKAGFSTEKRFPDWVPHPDMTHAFDWDDAMAAAKTYIPDEVVERFCLVGPPENAVAQIRALEKIGVHEVFTRWWSTYRIPEALVETYGESVIPAFR